jgi:hypothetical protein
MLEKKLLEEIKRYKEIYKYNYILNEQEAPLPPEGDAPLAPAPGVPPTPGGDVPLAPGGEEMPPMGDVGAETMGATEDVEEVDITDLVNMTKSIKKDLDASKQDNSGVISKMDDVFTKLNDLEQKLAAMDNLMTKIDSLGSRIDSMKPKTPEEKLELRSLDSYPFNQNPQQFFVNKQDEMRTSGKNEYVLTKDEIENYSKDEIRDTFNPSIEDDEYRF